MMARVKVMAAAGLIVAVMAMLISGSASAATPGSASLSVSMNVGVRAVTISPTSLVLCDPQTPLTFPSGNCTSPFITVTNGAAGGHIDVNGANALPNDGSGNGWQLCNRGQPSTCGNPAGSSFEPGQDQYSLSTAGSINTGEFGFASMSNTPQCDTAFDVVPNNNGSLGCAASAGMSSTEFLFVVGPAASSDQSPIFSTTVTWTAVP